MNYLKILQLFVNDNGKVFWGNHVLNLNSKIKLPIIKINEYIYLKQWYNLHKLNTKGNRHI